MCYVEKYGWALVAVLAVLAVTSSAAQAAEITVLPSPSEMAPVDFVVKGSESALWESASGKKIKCPSLSGSGKFTGARSGVLELKGTGCLNTVTLGKCTGLGDSTAGNISFGEEFRLRHLLVASEGVALLVLPEHVHFSCTGVLFLILGCVASTDLLTASAGVSVVEELSTSVFVKYSQEKGKQKPGEVLNEKSEADESCVMTLQEEAKAPEEGGFLWSGTLGEFNHGGNTVTLLVHLPLGGGTPGLWVLPSPSEVAPVGFVVKGSENAVWESASGKKIKCPSLSGNGKFTGARSGSFEWKGTGCLNTATLAKCTGLGDSTAGNISFGEEFRLRHLLVASEGVALLVLPEHVHFSCAGQLFLILGCVASMDLLTASAGVSVVEELVTHPFASFLQEAGKQKPGEVLSEKSKTDESCRLTIQEETRAPEEGGFLWSLTLEKLEQNAKEVSVLVHLKS